MRGSAKRAPAPLAGDVCPLLHGLARAALVPTLLPSGAARPTPTPTYSMVNCTTVARRPANPSHEGALAWQHPQRGAFPASPSTALPSCVDVCTAPAFGMKFSSPCGAPVGICSRTSSADGDVSSTARLPFPTSAHSSSPSGRRLVSMVLLYRQEPEARRGEGPA